MGRQDEKVLEGGSGEPEEEEEEGEFVDPLTVLREECEKLEKCVEFRETLKECEARVNSRSYTEETCSDELIDFLRARDKCVAEKLFSKLK